MANDDTLARALANVRHQRETLEAEYERVSGELAKLRMAERSLASIVEGTAMIELADDQPKRRRASNIDDQPRAGRGPRGPRANSAKGRLKALLEDAGTDGLTHAQITERLTDVAANTLATYLSVMSTSGELERHGDIYRAGAPAATMENQGSDDQAEGEAEDDQEGTGKTEAAE
ncbi:hypothetical protein FV242_18460 [Methylobacterium sp. WL64]|uniref:hypothetical protein n=1 Tax=Methylobacterium sp. WL64 TaxID=2603894 RepID=UPI0011C86171|nr:hypothetical protein [Methylobacterium sp. WL64]TXN01495.1 hypothetical protein FV242_18460 [Methylobacterium sp. WL64]